MGGEEFQPKSFSKVYSEFHIDKAKRIGAGGFGKVYLVARRKDGTLYAAKYQKIKDKRTQRLVQHEAEILFSLVEGKRVVTMFDYYEKREHSLLVLEYLQGGELFSKVGSSVYDLTEEKCKRFVVEIVKALIFIHDSNIIHLDLKPQNVMLVDPSEEFRLKLIDFGLARRLTNGYTHSGFCGTVGFMAPEVAHCQYRQVGHLASPATDFFSLGVIAYMLVSGGREPFWDLTELRTLRNTLRKDPEFHHSDWRQVSEDAKDFIRSCLEKEPGRRLSGQRCLDHPWIQERRKGPSVLHRLETIKMRRFMARYRWRRAIRGVRIIVRVKNSFLGIPEGL